MRRRNTIREAVASVGMVGTRTYTNCLNGLYSQPRRLLDAAMAPMIVPNVGKMFSTVSVAAAVTGANLAGREGSRESASR